MKTIAVTLSCALGMLACACEGVPTLTFAQADANADAAVDAADAGPPPDIDSDVEGGCDASDAQGPFLCCGAVVCEGQCTGQCDVCLSRCASGEVCCAKNNNVVCRSAGLICPP